MNTVTAALLVGFFGDALLQILVNNGFGGSTGWGLKEYFTQHGSAESLCIAAGMLGLFMIIYGILFTFKKQSTFKKILYLGIYGVILDFIFRKTMVFSSLKGYYNHLNYFESAIWGAIPMILIGLLVIFVDKITNQSQ